MEKEAAELIEWLKKTKDFSLPDYKELPKVPLYMEQVVTYVNNIIFSLTGEEKTLTPFMVNNYVKAKIIKEPTKKKYDETQLAYLIAISLLKDSLSMNEISLLIDMDSDIDPEGRQLYSFFKAMDYDIAQNSIERLLRRADEVETRFSKAKSSKDPKAETNLKNDLGLIALRLAIQASVAKRLSERLLDAMAKDVYGDKSYRIAETPGHKEFDRKVKISASEASRIAEAKQILSKEQKIAAKIDGKKRKEEAEKKKKSGNAAKKGKAK